MNSLARRINRLEPKDTQGKYEHLTDEELVEWITELNRQLLGSVAKGDPEKGYALFRNHCSVELPAKLVDYHTCDVDEKSQHLERFLVQQTESTNRVIEQQNAKA